MGSHQESLFLLNTNLVTKDSIFSKVLLAERKKREGLYARLRDGALHYLLNLSIVELSYDYFIDSTVKTANHILEFLFSESALFIISAPGNLASMEISMQ